MAVLLENGSKQSKGYEEAGLFLSRLEDYVQQTNHHISFTAAAINSKFAELKNDFDNRIISEAVYREFLQLFKDYLDKYPLDHPKDLNSKEMLKEIKRYWK